MPSRGYSTRQRCRCSTGYVDGPVLQKSLQDWRATARNTEDAVVANRIAGLCGFELFLRGFFGAGQIHHGGPSPRERPVVNREATSDVPEQADGPSIQHLYGIDIKTPWPVSGVPAGTAAQWDVEFVQGDPNTLAAAATHVPASQAQSWAQHAALPDGSTYRRWTDLFEFLVSADARHIQARTLKDGCDEVLVGYLLVDALSFSMVRLGWEPLHATAVLTKHGVAAFIAESGGGKSTIGALLVQSGCRLVTDDMLALTATHDRFVAEPGPPRIKLYRDIAVRIFGSARDGVKMNPVTDKLIIRLGADEVVREAHPLAAIYLIGEQQPRRHPGGPSIHRLSPASALPRILAATAAHYPSEPARLERQFNVRDGARQSRARQVIFVSSRQGRDAGGARRRACRSRPIRKAGAVSRRHDASATRWLSDCVQS